MENKLEDFSIVLSTMSPKVDRSLKKTKSKKVSRLALKTQLRRSSVYDKLPHTAQNNVVVSGSDTTETWSTSSGSSLKDTGYKNANSENIKIVTKLPHNALKFNEIEKWIAQINVENNKMEDIEACNKSVYSEISTIVNDHEKIHEIIDDSIVNFATNSTFVNDRNCFRFDEMFQQKKLEAMDDVQKKNNTNTICKTSDTTSDKNRSNNSILTIEDSYEEQQKFETPVKTKNEINEYENLLDELYGNSWRANKERVLTFSEPKQKKRSKIKTEELVSVTERKPKSSITQKNPYLIAEIDKSKSLIRTLQSTRLQMMIESPLSQRFQDVCDTESSSENLCHKSPINCNKKLTFDVSNTDDETDNSEMQKTENDFDKYINKTPRKKKNISYNNKENSTNLTPNRQSSFKIRYFSDKLKNHNFEAENKEDILCNEKNTSNSFSSVELEFEAVDDCLRNKNDLTKQKEENKNNDNKTLKTDKFDFDSIIRSLENKFRNDIALNKKSTFETTNKNKDIFKKIDTKNDKNINNTTKEDKQNKVKKEVVKGEKGVENKIRKNVNEKLDVSTKNKRTLSKNSIKYYETSSSDSEDNSDKKYIIEKQRNIKSNGPLSFLASLAASVPVDKCDASAKIFRNTFKNTKAELAKKLFDLYNEKIFNSGIPHDTSLEWSDRMRGTAGFCYCRKITRRTGVIERTAKIVLATKIVDSADRLRDTLVHEMCHAATWIVNEISDGHGPYWKAWAAKAMKEFPELPPIKRCHDYTINTKYTYKCTDCGYSFGRHTKSLDVERKCCGYCHGKFEIFINKTTKTGKKAVTPVTPKKQPTGFALFVKENYSNVKQENRTHAEVMKILSKKFAEVKMK